jgi:hypothetical protein
MLAIAAEMPLAGTGTAGKCPADVGSWYRALARAG